MKSTSEIIDWLLRYAATQANEVEGMLNLAADRLEALEERVAIMEEGKKTLDPNG